MSCSNCVRYVRFAIAVIGGFPARSALGGLLLAFLALIASVAAADVSVKASVGRDQVTLGEQFQLLITVHHDDGYTVSDPDVGKMLGDFVVVESYKGEDEGATLEFRYTLAGFKLDRATIASIEVGYIDPAGRPGKLATDPIGIAIVGTVPEGETEIKGIRGMVEIEPRMALWLKIVIWLGAIILAIAIAWWQLRKRRTVGIEEPVEKPPPPSVVALAALQRLVKSDLLFQKRYKEFYFALSEIIRRFLSGRLRFSAEDMTTTEIEFAMRDDPISREFTATTQEVLRFSDMVKFAKLIPSDPENDEIIEKARNTIELGREPLFETETEPIPQVGDSSPNREKGGGMSIAE